MIFEDAGLSLCSGGEQEACGGVGTRVGAGMLPELLEEAAGDKFGEATGAGMLPELGDEAAEDKVGEAAVEDKDTDWFLQISFTELFSSFICSYRNF